MKIKEISILLTIFFFIVSFGYAQDSTEPAITMSFKPNGEVTIFIAGNPEAGSVVIDWGDGSPTHTHPLAHLKNMIYDDKVHAVSHTYSTTSDCIISITGKLITAIKVSSLGLTSLVLNTPLEYVVCEDNKLTSLDVSKSERLFSLNCGKNQLTSLDVSNNIYLFILDFRNNQLSSIDVSKNGLLQFLTCSSNQLTSLNVSMNRNLITLDCNENQLTAEAINALFVSLNATNRASIDNLPKMIHIEGNPGTDACNKKIAESRSWKVISKYTDMNDFIKDYLKL